MNKKIFFGIIALAIIIVSVIATVKLINAKPAPQKDSQKHNVVYVKASKASISDIDSEMKYRGRVTAFDNISLASEVQGKITKGDVRFKAGESFNKGDILVKIYSRDVEATLKSGKSGLLQAISSILPDIKIDFPDEYEKWNTFFNAIDTDKPLPKLPKVNSNKEKVFLASNNVLSTYYTLEQQEINLGKYIIKAPFNGSFTSVSKEIGAIANTGTELATITRTDKLEITVPVFPSDLKWVKKGNKVKIHNNRDIETTATVSRISDFVDESTQTVLVYLSYYATGNNRLLQGEYVDVTFGSSKVKGLELPREAIVDDSFVYELKDEKLVKTPISIQRKLDDTYIISGIDTSNVIVVESMAQINSDAIYKAR